MMVTAPGAEIRVEDIPPEFGGKASLRGGFTDWSQRLGQWAESTLQDADAEPLLSTALPEFERTLIRAALAHAQGHRQEAARLLGWGRNTLTRKIRERKIDG